MIVVMAAQTQVCEMLSASNRSGQAWHWALHLSAWLGLQIRDFCHLWRQFMASDMNRCILSKSLEV